MCWNIIFLQSPTESPDRVTRRQTAQQRNSIFPPRIVWDWVLYMFDKAWSGNQIVGMLITVAGKKKKEQTTKRSKKREKPTLLRIISHSLMNFAVASSSEPPSDGLTHLRVTEPRFEQKNRLPTLKKDGSDNAAKTFDHHYLASGQIRMRCGAKHGKLCQGLACTVTCLPIR